MELLLRLYTQMLVYHLTVFIIPLEKSSEQCFWKQEGAAG